MQYNQLSRMEEIEKVKHSNAVFLDCVGGNFAGGVTNALRSDSMMANP
jgi:hypothetical protein